jgi:hypothetical protein
LNPIAHAARLTHQPSVHEYNNPMKAGVLGADRLVPVSGRAHIDLVAEMAAAWASSLRVRFAAFCQLG